MSSCARLEIDPMVEDDRLMDVGFMFDAAIEKATRQFDFGDDIKVQVSYVEQEPGALQSGHYVWPAAPALCDYLKQNWTTLPHGNIVEVGAGCGLAGKQHLLIRIPGSDNELVVGLVAAQLSNSESQVVFTDHDPGVLRTIQHNVQLQTAPQAKCSTQNLRWGPTGKQEISIIEQTLGGSVHPAKLILGSDVIYAQGVISLLFWTVNELLSHSKDAMFLMCSSFAYDDAMEKEIDLMCLEHRFKREIVFCELEKAPGGVRIQQFSRLPNAYN